MFTKRIGYICILALALLFALPMAAQDASLTGTVRDAQGGVIAGAAITLTNSDTGVSQNSKSDGEGNYAFPVVKPGTYTVKVEQKGFQAFVQNGVVLAVDSRGRADATLQVGETSTAVTVADTGIGVQTESSSLGSVVETKQITEIPLNGRFFLDLALLQAGTVVPSTNNRTFLAVPSGIGMSGINASGTREDSTNYLVDGINVSDMVQNQITFQPNIDMIQEFKVQTNAFSAEYGRNAGIIVNAVSKSGTNGLHGSAYEFIRNQRFDAKNFFDPAGPIIPFNRNIFGYSVGGPIAKNRTFFFTSYEGRRAHEVASLKTQVPSAAQRASVTNPIIQKLLTLVPAANDSTGTFFVGPTPRNRTLNQFTGRIDHTFSTRDFLYGSFISNHDQRTEPTLQNNNLPGYGDFRPAKRYLLTLGYTHMFSSTITNELRAGLNRVRIDFNPSYTGKPSDFGITSPSGVFPEVEVSGGMFFGGITGFPQGRGDTTFHYADTVSWVKGRHTIKYGAEFRRFRNNNFNGGTGGVILFSNLAGFLAGTPTQTTETAVAATPALRVNALGTFVQDDFKVNRKLTLNLGLRWEYNGVPSEKYDRLANFYQATNTVVRVGTNGIKRPYERQFTAFGPRFGFAYDPFGDGKTVIRGGTGLYYDQPVTNLVSVLGSNPPFSQAVNITSGINLATPFNAPPGSGSALNFIDPNFRYGRVFSYNFNVQREFLGTVIQVAYVGSQGRHLRLIGDFNQAVGGRRPYSGYSAVTGSKSVSNSNYNGLWLSGEKRLSKGFSLNTSFTWSKSIDNNSVGSSNAQVQNIYNISGERALSDFDARFRYVLSGIYLLPFKGGQNGVLQRIVEGWSLSPIVNLQSGNPFSPIISSTNANSLETFTRPDIIPGASLSVPNPSTTLWFNTAAFACPGTISPVKTCATLNSFGNAGRNILTAPGFSDIDFAIAKNTKIVERVGLQFRAEAFNLFNHPNFGQAGNSFTAATFGQITATRSPRGDLGSSRQLQLGLKLIF